jgi:hypothetical protein
MFLLDDRFQTIYCFLFGLGFAIQMLRAEERNAPFVSVFLRRMLALFLIGCVFHIFFSWSYTVLPFYAIIGIWLLLFRKVPVKFLPLLAIFFSFLPVTINTITKIKTPPVIETQVNKNIIVDTAILDKYAGVYKVIDNIKVIFFRKGDVLIGESPTKQFYLAAVSDSQFYRNDIHTQYTFIKDSSGEVSSIKAEQPSTGTTRFFTRIKEDLQVALKRQIEQRPEALKGLIKQVTYRQHVQSNFDQLWSYLKKFPWQNFLWKGNYEVGYILVLFILGLYAGRKKLFHNVSGNKHFFQRTFKWGLIVGTPLIIFSTGFNIWNYVRGIRYWEHPSPLVNALFHLIWLFEMIALAMAYIAGLALLLENDRWKERLILFGNSWSPGLDKLWSSFTCKSFYFSKR